jgi:tryptophan-rich sensory protein
MDKNNFVKLVVSIIVCEGAGMVGAIFTTPAIAGWYAGLNKPSINPPSWVFAPVWTALFLLMGISLYLVWLKKFTPRPLKNPRVKVWNKLTQKFLTGSWQKANVVLVFAVQLVLNVLWSIIFFGWHQPGIAFFELLTLWFAILYTIVNFYRVSKPAAYLLVPYLLWVTFAGLLNYFLWTLNF